MAQTIQLCSKKRGSALAGAWLKSNLALISPNPVAGSNRGFKSYFRDITLTSNTHKHTRPTQSCQCFIETVTVVSICGVMPCQQDVSLHPTETFVKAKENSNVGEFDSAPWFMSRPVQSTDNGDKYKAIRRKSECMGKWGTTRFFSPLWRWNEMWSVALPAGAESFQILETVMDSIWCSLSLLSSCLGRFSRSAIFTQPREHWWWWRPAVRNDSDCLEMHSRRRGLVSSGTTAKWSQSLVTVRQDRELGSEWSQSFSLNNA